MIKAYDAKTGKFLGHYKTQSEAAKAYGATQGSVSQILSGRCGKTCNGITFKQVPINWDTAVIERLTIKELVSVINDIDYDLNYWRDEGEYWDTTYRQLSAIQSRYQQELENRRNEINKLF